MSDATLSYLEQLPDEKCRWVQHTPPGEPKTVFTAPRYCRLELAWNPDGREALVTDRTQHQIWRVDLATGTSTPFSSQALRPGPGRRAGPGPRLPPGDGWNVDALRVEKALKDVPEDSPDFAALSAVREPSEIGGWKQLKTAAGPLYLYLWNDPSQDPEPHTGLVRIRGEEGLVEPEGLSFDTEFSVNMRGDLVLLTPINYGGKPMARLWNARTKKLVASLHGQY